MKYRIVSDYIDGKVDIELSKEHYDSLSAAIETIRKSTDAEEIFLVCVYNYEDYERHLLQSALTDMVYQKHHYSDFWSISTRTHQHLANFLSSCRAYLDQIKTLAGGIGKEPSVLVADIKASTNKWYDDSLSYRFMEGLRNFVQHRGFGVHGLSFGHRWTPKGEQKMHRMHFWLEPYVLAARLAEDGNVKKSILAEFGTETVPISPHVREYMRAIGDLQHLFRIKTKQAVDDAKQLMNEALESYRKLSDGGSTLGAKAVAEENGMRVGQFPILRETLDYHDEIIRKVNPLTNLEFRVVSSAGPE